MGTVGRTKVVSTKLSRTPGSAQAAIISAENTVTRLLGTSTKLMESLVSAAFLSLFQCHPFLLFI